jgi:UDP-glucose 4-epimerase
MKVLVTGGAGFIGSHLVDALVARGDSVIVVDDYTTGKAENLNPAASAYRVDIRDAESLEAVFAAERPEIVSHHAAQTDVRRSMADPALNAEINVVGTINLLHCCVRYGVRKVILASTCAVYPETKSIPVNECHAVRPASAYGLSKYFGERYLAFCQEVYGLRYTIFRYGNVYGPRQDPDGECGVVAIFCSQLLNGVRPTIYGDGSKTRDYVYVEDVAAANLMAIDGEGDGSVFNLGWGREVRDVEVLEAVRKAVGVPVEPAYADKRPGELNRIALDSAKARRLLGWAPVISFEDGVRLSVAYYRRQSKAIYSSLPLHARSAAVRKSIRLPARLDKAVGVDT